MTRSIDPIKNDRRRSDAGECPVPTAPGEGTLAATRMTQE